MGLLNNSLNIIMNINEAIEDNTVTIKDIDNLISHSTLNDEILACEINGVEIPINPTPFHCDTFIVMVCRAGRCKLKIDLNEYEIIKNTLLIIQPNSYLCINELDQEFDAICVACSVDLVENSLVVHPGLMKLLIHYRLNPATQLTSESANNIAEYYNFIKSKIDSPVTVFTKPKLTTLLQSALYEVLEAMEFHKGERIAAPTRKEEIMAKFIRLVSDNFINDRSVRFYADKLCISPKHLSTVVRNISGMTAGEWIDNYVILEAKMKLRSTTLSIQEISNQLNFANQSFFGKYFKHITGLSPTDYRNTL